MAKRLAKKWTMGGPIVLPAGPVDLGRTRVTPGFAIEIEDDTELGLAMLIAESEDGCYEPVGVVASINEAREVAANDLRNRCRDLEGGGEPMCPYEYKVWARGIDGEYKTLARISATDRTLM